MKFSTKAIHIGHENIKDGDVTVPIHLSTTFAKKKVSDRHQTGYDYSRTGNPTRNALEQNLAALDNGTNAYAFASGMAAITTILLLLKPGDHVVSIDNVYGGTYRLFTKLFAEKGIEFTFADFSDANSLKSYIKKNTKLIWLESPTNPSLKVIDLKSVADFAKTRNILTGIDNTMASPYFQKPLDLGIDIVMHSLTKYLGGHSDTIGGSIAVKDTELAKRIQFLQNTTGAILSPFDSYNVLKGIKTLAVRMEKHQKNAKKVVEFLSSHKKIKKVYYPGFGGMVSFELQGTFDNAVKFLESLKLIALAVSFGAVESLIEHPASMTHATFSKEDREKSGIPDTLIRLSVGIEDVEDIIEDLSRGFTSI